MDSRYVIQIDGKDFVKFEGLLAEGHTKGIKSLKVELIQMPNKDNEMTAVCRATLQGKADDNIYSDLGDASPSSVDIKILPHLIRMTSTRAKARVLRDYTNTGMCSVEELNLSDTNLPTVEAITDSQHSLLTKLAKERNININMNSINRKSASVLISELQSKRTG